MFSIIFRKELSFTRTVPLATLLPLSCITCQFASHHSVMAAANDVHSVWVSDSHSDADVDSHFDEDADSIPETVVRNPSIPRHFDHISGLITALAAIASSIIVSTTPSYEENKRNIEEKANQLENQLNKAQRKLEEVGVIFDGHHNPVNDDGLDDDLDDSIPYTELTKYKFYIAEHRRLNLQEDRVNDTLLENDERLDDSTNQTNLWNEFYRAGHTRLNFIEWRSLSSIHDILKVHRETLEQVSIIASAFAENSKYGAPWHRSLQKLEKICQYLEKCNECRAAILAKPKSQFTDSDMRFLYKCDDLRIEWHKTGLSTDTYLANLWLTA